MRLAFGSFFLMMLATVSFGAQTPRFNYQAKLTAGAGVPLSGTHTLYFRLYQGGTAGAADSGTLVYEENASLSLANGIVSHPVGTGTGQTFGPLSPDMLRTDQDVFVQVSVDSPGNVILPRTRLESVPYSLLSADGDARHPLTGPAPIVLSDPGSYYLTGNLSGVSGENGITITTSSVRLDLNGYTLIGTPGSQQGINVEYPVSNVEIFNGAVSGWGDQGISSQISDTQIHVHHIRATGNGFAGISLGAQSLVEECFSQGNISPTDMSPDGYGIIVGDESIVRKCVCCGNLGIPGQFGDGNGVGIRAINGCNISDCICSGNIGGGFGRGVGIWTAQFGRVCGNVCRNNESSSAGGQGVGISADWSEISGNTCSQNGASNLATDATGIGIDAGEGAHVHDNDCGLNYGRGLGWSVGIRLTGSSRVENNHCADQGLTNAQNYGIQAYGTADHNAIIKNTMTGNTTAGIRFENTSGTNYYAENVFDEATSVSEAAGGVNVPGTGDRSNVAF